jgi:hypothetical protein
MSCGSISWPAILSGKNTLKIQNCMGTMCVQDFDRHICCRHVCGKIPAGNWTCTLPAWIIYFPKHGANKTQNWRIKRLENQPPHSLFTNIHKQIIGQKNSQATESTLLGKTSNERNVVRMSLKQNKMKTCSHHLSSNILNKLNKCGKRCMFGKHVFYAANFGIEGFRKMFEMTRLWTCMQHIQSTVRSWHSFTQCLPT